MRLLHIALWAAVAVIGVGIAMGVILLAVAWIVSAIIGQPYAG